MSTGLVRKLEQDWGDRVRDRRKALGFSQAQLADTVRVREDDDHGVSQQTISKIEAGVLAPRDNLKVAIARVLGTRPHLLFPWPGQEDVA